MSHSFQTKYFSYLFNDSFYTQNMVRQDKNLVGGFCLWVIFTL